MKAAMVWSLSVRICKIAGAQAKSRNRRLRTTKVLYHIKTHRAS